MRKRKTPFGLAIVSLVTAATLLNQVVSAITPIIIVPGLLEPSVSALKTDPATDYDPASGATLKLSFNYTNLSSQALLNAKIYHYSHYLIPITDHSWNALSRQGSATDTSLTWDGKDTSSKTVADGTYFFEISGTDGSNGSTKIASTNVTFTVKNSLFFPPLPIQDTIPPTLTEKTKVVQPTIETKPSYTFTSSEAGTIGYTGDCSSSKTDAVAGDNTITFNTLSTSTHSNCKITVKDKAGLTSAALQVTPFTIDPISYTPISIAPVLTKVTDVPTPTTNSSPNFTFSSSQAGTIVYGGDCSSTKTSAGIGNNQVTFNTLSLGTHSNCTVQVYNSLNKYSSKLAVNSFTVVETSIPVNPSSYCAGFSDVNSSDTKCPALTWVKSAKIFTGNPDGTFDPYGLLQRDQIAKVVLEAFKKFQSGNDYCNGVNPFPDVGTGSWARQYICLGKQTVVNGQYLLTGYKSGPNAGYFLPANAVNRSEFLAMVLRNLSQTMPSSDVAYFKDVTVNSWDTAYANYAYLHLNSIYTGTYLNREKFVTRAEAAQVLYTLHIQGSI